MGRSLILTPKYLIWEQWCENGRHPPRPFYSVPAQWFVFYKARHLKPKPIETYNGFYAQHHGALFREPGGNIENVEEQKVYLGWSAIDLRARGNWNTQIATNRKYNVPTLAWMQCFSEQDVDFVFAHRNLNEAGHCVLNIEQEILTTLPPSFIRQKIATYQRQNPTAEVLVVPLPWVQNGQGWQALKDVPTLIEIFTNEKPQFTAAVCIEHAKNEGLNILGCLWGAYPVNNKFPDPKNYPLHSYKLQAIYTGDDVKKWSDWV